MSGISAHARNALVIEDEPLIVMLLADMLEELGYRMVGSCGAVAEALEFMRQNAIDVAILDIDLGGESGYVVADALERGGIPFVLMSGLSGKPPPPYQDRKVLAKPFQVGDLEKALNTLLGPQTRAMP